MGVEWASEELTLAPCPEVVGTRHWQSHLQAFITEGLLVLVIREGEK